MNAIFFIKDIISKKKIRKVDNMERKIEELQPEHSLWIEKTSDLGLEICEAYGIKKEQAKKTSELDVVFKAWKTDKNTSKPTDSEIINGLSCLFGKLMIAEFGLEWRIITDDYGTEFALTFPKSSWEIYPRDFVAKRVYSPDDESGFFRAMQDLIKNKLEKK